MRLGLCLALLTLLSTAIASAQTTSVWQLVWSDEFNGSAGSPPDPAKWNYDLGQTGWGNGELENYTNSTNNAFQDGNGNLVIRAIRDSSGNYTSARLQTGKPGASTQTTDGHWQYGRIEARAKLPFGQAVWPAFWMLGEDISQVNWPQCGEIDIMENFGTFNNNVSINNGSAHGPGYSGGEALTAAYTLPFGEQVNDDYHVYAIEWSQDSIEWFVDGASYEKRTPASLPAGAQWVYNNQFFILLNLAIGGPTSFLGTPVSSAPFPNQDLVFDYVRVYQATAVSATTPVITPGRIVNAASFLGAIAPGSLAAVYGQNMADNTYPVSPSAGDPFPTSAAGVSVNVNGVAAPLIYVSPTQINFQVPWETVPGPAVNVQVTRNAVASKAETMTVAALEAPSFFINDYTTGIVWVSGTSCATPECAVAAGGVYQLWANGLGPKTSPLEDGVVAPLAVLPVAAGSASCKLTIGGQSAHIYYCGAAPGELIDQVNFGYPSGVSSSTPWVEATFTLNGVTSYFRVPSPVSTQ